MTQKGETTGYTASDHVQAIIDHIGEDSLDAVVVHNETISEAVRERYKKRKCRASYFRSETNITHGLKNH